MVQLSKCKKKGEGTKGVAEEKTKRESNCVSHKLLPEFSLNFARRLITNIETANRLSIDSKKKAFILGDHLEIRADKGAFENSFSCNTTITTASVKRLIQGFCERKKSALKNYEMQSHKMCKEKERLSWLVSIRKHKNQSKWSSFEPLYPRNFQEVYKDLIKANGLVSNKSFRV